MDDEEIAEVNAAVASHEGTQQSVMAQTIVGGKNFCDVDNCQGFNFLPGATCVICEADVHMECFLGTVRKLNEYPQGCHNEVFLMFVVVGTGMTKLILALSGKNAWNCSCC